MKRLITILIPLTLMACNTEQSDVTCWHSIDNDLVCTEINASVNNARYELTAEEHEQLTRLRMQIEYSGMSKKVMAQLMADLMQVAQ